MSFLFKPSGGAIAGTAVDPAGPSGVLIAPSEIVDPGAPTPLGWVLTADGAGGWVASSPASLSETFSIPLSHDAGVPAAGTRFLRFGQGVISSTTGFTLSGAGSLRGITITVQGVSANDYAVEVLSDPAGKLGVPAVLASLPLPNGTSDAQVSSLSVPITLGTEIGARVVRTAGAGSFVAQMSVLLEFSIP